jgi:hypothetical protein
MRRHSCRWPGCNALIGPEYWACRGHWAKLPQYLRSAIGGSYVPGQTAETASKAWIEADDSARAWAHCHERLDRAMKAIR